MNDEAVVTQDGSTAAVSLTTGAHPAEVVVATFFAGRNDRRYHLQGKLSDVAIYDGALSAEEVVRHYKAAGPNAEPTK